MFVHQRILMLLNTVNAYEIKLEYLELGKNKLSALINTELLLIALYETTLRIQITETVC